jgi:hypothetical protein
VEQDNKGRRRHPARVACIEEARNPRRNRGGPRYKIPPTVETSVNNDLMAKAPSQPVVYIHDGIRRWWRIRRFQVMGALLRCVGIIVGMITGHIIALLLGGIR